eukprot:s1367_g8.t1
MGSADFQEQPDEVSPWAMEVTLPEHQVTLAQERVNAFLQALVLVFWMPRFIQILFVLAHPCNVGYHNLSNLILSRFAGQPMRNVAELARAVSRCEEEQLVFNFQRPHGDGGELVVLDRKEAIDAEPEILAQHLIAAPCMVRSDGKGEPRPLDSLQPNEPEAVAVTCHWDPVHGRGFIPRLNSGWPPTKEGRNREGASLLRSGSDTSLGPTARDPKDARAESKQFGRVYQAGRWDVPNLFLPSLTYENPKATAHFRQKVCDRDYDAVRLLLHAGFPPSAPLSPRQHRTGLFLAVEMGDVLMCQLLVSFKADPFQRLKPQDLRTFGDMGSGKVQPHPLDLAVQNDQLPIIHFFSLHREVPQALDRGNTLPTRQEFPLRLEMKANEDGFWGSRAPRPMSNPVALQRSKEGVPQWDGEAASFQEHKEQRCIQTLTGQAVEELLPNAGPEFEENIQRMKVAEETHAEWVDLPSHVYRKRSGEHVSLQMGRKDPY